MASNSVIVEKVHNWRMAKTLRAIRNDCREWMTGDQSEISLWQQWRWWRATRNDSDWQAFLFSDPVVGGQLTVAFGTLRKLRDISIDVMGTDAILLPDGWWATGGVSKQFRGLGFGQAVFETLDYISDRPLYLDVLVTNEIARDLYYKLGWHELGHRRTKFGAAIVMEHV